MKQVLTYIIYAPLWLLLHAIGLLPFCVLYVIADFIYILVYRIFRYRVKIVRKNLRDSFPDKDEQWLSDIEKKFYHHFADYFVETIKVLHISDNEMRKRMEFVNMELVNQAMENHRSVALFIGHLGNWEWITSITRWFTETDNFGLCQIYQKLNNKWFDDFFKKLRGRFDTVCLEKHEAFRQFVTWKREGKSIVCGFIADQHPSGNDRNRSVRFLNHDTGFMTGTEEIARRLDMECVYFDIECVKRGYYRTTVRKITLTPKDEPEHSITDAYVQMLEANIRRQPEMWLWTHNRWKRPITSPVQPFTPLNNPIE